MVKNTCNISFKTLIVKTLQYVNEPILIFKEILQTNYLY